MPKKFNALFDAIDTFLRTPATVTDGRCHVRDAVDMKRIMITVMIALVPALVFGWWNVGFQHFRVLYNCDDCATLWQCLWYGFLKWLPLVIVTYVSGLGVEVLFAQIRKEEVAEGFFVTGFLIPMIMPPDVPLWIVAVATIFAVLFGKEVFGGTGYNFLNPALLARAFVFFAYPSVISGDQVWVSGADAVTCATPLSFVMNGHPEAVPSTAALFFGDIPGCIGETCKLAILLGAAILLFTQVADWRIMIPVFNLDVRGGLMPNDQCDIEQYTTKMLPFSRSIACEGDVVVPVYGDSMSPRYPSGSHILIRPLPMWREWLELGQSYVLELSDWRRTIKIVRKGATNDTYRLECYNVDYDTTEIPKSLIEHIWQVLMCVKREVM